MGNGPGGQWCVVWRSVLRPHPLSGAAGLESCALPKASSRRRCLLTRAWQHRTGLYPSEQARAADTPHISFSVLRQTVVSPGQFLQLVIDVVIEGLLPLGSD